MLHLIYIVCMFIITFGVVFYYYVLDAEHRRELDKINKMEALHNKELQQLETLRSQTVPCQIGNFTDPRSCYIDSGFECSWNELAKRCDQKA